MRVLLTGVAGFLGQNLARAYLKKGWEVFGIDDLSVGCENWLPAYDKEPFSSVKFSRSYDVSDKKGFSFIFPCKSTEQISFFDLIIHLASRKIPRHGNSYETLTENTQGLLNITNFAVEIKTKLIYLSTSDVYGQNPDCREDSHMVIGTPDVMRWSYAISKMWGEQLLYSTPADFNFNIVRLFNSYGPYHALSWTAGPQSVFISQALKKEPMTIHGDGKQMRAFQYADDAVDGIIRVTESEYRRQVFNIGNPNEPISIDDMSRMIWKIVNPGMMRPAVYVPASKFKYEEIPERVPDISKARGLLGFEPKISLEEGLRRTIEWQRTVM